MASADKGTSRIPRAARSLDDAAHQGRVFKAGRKASSHAGASPEKWRGAMDSCRWLDNASGPETDGRRRSYFSTGFQLARLDASHCSRHGSDYDDRSRHLSRSRLWIEQSRDSRKPEQAGLLVPNRIQIAQRGAGTPSDPHVRRDQLRGRRLAQRAADWIDQRRVHPRCVRRECNRESRRAMCSQFEFRLRRIRAFLRSSRSRAGPERMAG